MIFIYLYAAMSIKHTLSIAIMSLLAVPAAASTQSEMTSVPDTIFFDDGSLYIGEIADSLFNGYGKMIYADSTVYQGEWENGMWHGQGELFYPDGDCYMGEFSEHEFNGYGTYIYADSSRYEGYWKDGLFNGAGTMEYSNGSTYTGLWENDRKEGIGIFYDADQDILYKGYFHNDILIATNHQEYEESLSFDNKFEYSQQPTVTYIGLTIGTGQIASLQLAFGKEQGSFFGFNVGFSVKERGIGEVSTVFDDETGEKITLVGWDWHMEEVVTEQEYPIAQILADYGWRFKRFSLGGSAGIGIISTVRNCRGSGESYFDKGELYYREKVTGVKICYRLFTDLALKEFDYHSTDLRNLYLRLGYGRYEGPFLGVGISF